MATAIENDVSGYVETRLDRLIERMQELLVDLEKARRLGHGARRRALERFSLERFVQDWNRTLRQVAGWPIFAARSAAPEPQTVGGNA
jgi:glycosyltransferase involved in cell wall biosynthesis